MASACKLRRQALMSASVPRSSVTDPGSENHGVRMLAVVKTRFVHAAVAGVRLAFGEAVPVAAISESTNRPFPTAENRAVTFARRTRFPSDN